jgi:hypothetical protein
MRAACDIPAQVVLWICVRVFMSRARQGGSGWAGPGKAIQKLETGEAGLLFYLLIGKLDKTITCTEVLNTI